MKPVVKFRAKIAKMGRNLIIVVPKAIHPMVERGKEYIVALYDERGVGDA